MFSSPQVLCRMMLNTCSKYKLCFKKKKELNYKVPKKSPTGNMYDYKTKTSFSYSDIVFLSFIHFPFLSHSLLPSSYVNLLGVN